MIINENKTDIIYRHRHDDDLLVVFLHLFIAEHNKKSDFILLMTLRVDNISLIFLIQFPPHVLHIQWLMYRK